MKLIGMLDSPFVRRTAISLKCLDIPFQHNAISVFSTFAEFQAINPVVKAPTLVFDDGEILMDSNLIIDFAESVAQKTLMPVAFIERKQALRIMGFSLAACEKVVHNIYERNLRPKEKQHAPWLERVNNQLLAACAALEIEIIKHPFLVENITKSQAAITAAVAWQFIQGMLPDIVNEAHFPALRKLSLDAEKMPEFLAFPPVGPGVGAP